MLKSNYIGQPDSVHVYQNRTRNISFNIKVLGQTEQSSNCVEKSRWNKRFNTTNI